VIRDGLLADKLSAPKAPELIFKTEKITKPQLSNSNSTDKKEDISIWNSIGSTGQRKQQEQSK